MWVMNKLIGVDGTRKLDKLENIKILCSLKNESVCSNLPDKLITLIALFGEVKAILSALKMYCPIINEHMTGKKNLRNIEVHE